MRGVWVRTALVLVLLTLVATDRAVALWAGAVAGALALGALLLGPMLDALAVRAALSASEVFAGEEVAVDLLVVNRGFVPVPDLRVSAVLPERLQAPPARWLVAVPARQAVALRYAVPARRRGVYQVGQVAFEAGDWFGLWRREGAADAGLWLTVFPRPAARDLALPPPRLPMGSSRLPTSPFRALEPAGLREYRRGDPVRWIAWKASAHRGDLVVREFPPVRDRAHLLVVDLRSAPWPEADREVWVERALSLAARWVLRAAERDEAVGLYAWGRAVRFGPPGTAPPPEAPGAVDLPARRGPRHRRDVLRALALLQLADGPPFLPGALAALRRSPQSSVLWLAGRVDEETLGGASLAARQGHAVSLVVPRPRTPGPLPSGVRVWPLPEEVAAP